MCFGRWTRCLIPGFAGLSFGPIAAARLTILMSFGRPQWWDIRLRCDKTRFYSSHPFRWFWWYLWSRRWLLRCWNRPRREPRYRRKSTDFWDYKMWSRKTTGSCGLCSQRIYRDYLQPQRQEWLSPSFRNPSCSLLPRWNPSPRTLLIRECSLYLGHCYLFVVQTFIN